MDWFKGRKHEIYRETVVFAHHPTQGGLKPPEKYTSHPRIRPRHIVRKYGWIHVE
jgi:hypothetical protein